MVLACSNRRSVDRGLLFAWCDVQPVCFLFFLLAVPVKTFTGAPTGTSLHYYGNPSFRFSRVFCLPSIDFSVAYLELPAIKVDFLERVD